jgi:hypothetical protein
MFSGDEQVLTRRRGWVRFADLRARLTHGGGPLGDEVATLLPCGASRREALPELALRASGASQREALPELALRASGGMFKYVPVIRVICEGINGCARKVIKCAEHRIDLTIRNNQNTKIALSNRTRTGLVSEMTHKVHSNERILLRALWLSEGIRVSGSLEWTFKNTPNLKDHLSTVLTRRGFEERDGLIVVPRTASDDFSALDDLSPMQCRVLVYSIMNDDDVVSGHDSKRVDALEVVALHAGLSTIRKSEHSFRVFRHDDEGAVCTCCVSKEKCFDGEYRFYSCELDIPSYYTGEGDVAILVRKDKGYTSVWVVDGS